MYAQIHFRIEILKLAVCCSYQKEEEKIVSPPEKLDFATEGLGFVHKLSDHLFGET